MTINQLLQKLEPTSPILQANFGIERESLRVDRQGKLAHTPHPSRLGAQVSHIFKQIFVIPDGAHHTSCQIDY